MECTVREFDRMIIRGLRSDNVEVRDNCIDRLFYEDLYGLLEKIRIMLFKGSVDYDDLVNDLYILLSRANWKILDGFQGRNGAGLKTWLSHIVWNHFLHESKRSRRMEYADDVAPFFRNAAVVTRDDMRIDVERTLDRMPNRRLARVIRLLLIEEREVEEVSRMLETTVSNVYNLKHRAIKQFLEIYGT